MASLDNPFARLRRAREHCNALHEMAQAFTETDPYSFTIEREDDWDIVSVHIHHQPPIELGVLFGDFLHNLRAALDNLAWQLVLLNGNRPTRQTAFPVAQDQRAFDSHASRQLAGMTAQHQKRIAELQPFAEQVGNGGHALDLIHEMARIDRHRIVHPVLMGPAKTDVPFILRREPINTDVFIEGRVTAANNALLDGAEVARFRTSTPGDQPPVEIKADLLVEIAFGERGLRLFALPTVGIEIGAVVKAFEPDFALDL